MTDESLLRELLAALSQGRPVVLATVIGTERSAPRRAGSKMLVYPDGAISATIGGGELEARVRSEAALALQDGKPRRISFDLVDPASGDPGVCGGRVELYLEPHMPTATILIVGAGHVGRAVVELAHWLGYRVAVWDDRDELLDDVTLADVVLHGPIAEAIATDPITERTRVVMVTRNSALDVEILPPLLASPAAYIGLMGSRRRWAITADRLRSLGVTDEALARVQTPIGVDIAAETPAELAVSVMAAIIAFERGSATA